MSNIENVRKNNMEINKKIAMIVEKYKAMNKTAFDKNGRIDEDIKKLFELEMKKCVAIYLAEFSCFECKEIDKLTVEIEEREEKKNQADARGGANGIKIYPGMQHFIDNFLKNAGIESEEINGKICAKKIYSFEQGRKGLEQEIDINGENKYAEGINPPQYISERMIDSSRDQLDFFAEILKKGKIDIDWILDVLPHEAMHVFIPGKGTLVEGTTERFARECADKYGLRLTPTSHQRETQLISKIEKIIGRENLARTMTLSNKENEIRDSSKAGEKEIDEARLNKVEKAVDSVMGIGTFEKLEPGFEREYEKFLIGDKEKNIKPGKLDFANYRNKYYLEEETVLDEYIEEHDKKIFSEEECFLSNPDEEKLKVVLELQKDEIKMLEELEKKSEINKSDKQIQVKDNSDKEKCFSREKISSIAKQEQVAMEYENTSEIMNKIERSKQREDPSYVLE